MFRSTVVKLGGHVLFDGMELNLDYLRGLKEVLNEALQLYDCIAVTVGGGEIARKYIGWGRSLGLNESTLDVIGLRLAAVNAALLWAYFHNVAPPQIPSSLHEAVAALPVWKVIFIGGLQPAQSTTTVAALLAEALNAEKLVIATDVDGVYDDDPKRNPHARKFDEVTVSDIEGIFAGNLVAGGYRLLDPMTLSIIRRSRVTTFVISGKPPINILRALKGERIGTRIIPR
ncbi:MAG: UMP kinase [Thermofilaceae archaeon]